VTQSDLPSLHDLLAAYGEEDSAMTVTPFSQGGRDPGNILRYLASLGIFPQSLNDLYHAIQSLDDEDELAAWRVREGVVVSVASQGEWHVFTP
jgi:hypothetical protein